MPYLFCNIGWMEKYSGLEKTGDELKGGGKFVNENKKGHEVCNFLSCRGTTYGYVESSIGEEKDTHIKIERIGALKNSDYVDGIDVIWMATHPDEGRRRVVGWYRNARVYRDRQFFSSAPTKQHKLDSVNSFRITTREAVLLPSQARNLDMSKGKGWMGEKAWWYGNPANVEIREFLDMVGDLISGKPVLQVSSDEVLSSRVFEGAKKSITVNVYERDPTARRKCIQYWGAKCSVCQFDFGNVYGEVGKGFIHVHHLKPLSQIKKSYVLNPINDLRPVCPNCHSMLHVNRDKVMGIDELKKQIKR